MNNLEGPLILRDRTGTREVVGDRRPGEQLGRIRTDRERTIGLRAARCRAARESQCRILEVERDRAGTPAWWIGRWSDPGADPESDDEHDGSHGDEASPLRSSDQPPEPGNDGDDDRQQDRDRSLERGVRMPRAVVQDATDRRADDQRADQHHADADGSAATMDRRRLLHSREHTQGSDRLHDRRELHPDRRRSGVRSPAQALQLAPQALARTTLPSNEREPWPGLPHDGRAVVHVAGRGYGGPDTRLDRPQDLDDALTIGDEGLYPITSSYLRRRLCRRSIHEDVATVTQPGRERAGLHEAHRAQPAIDARLVGGEGLSHKF